jgi:futalosine hydrolase
MILIVSASFEEVSLLFHNKSYSCGEVIPFMLGKHTNLSLLVTGVGAVPTAFHLSTALLSGKYTKVINIGIAGSFRQKLRIGDVVAINQDTFADYGIDNNGVFETLFENSLAKKDQKPFEEGWMKCNHLDSFGTNLQLPKVKAITVATTSGSKSRIDHHVERYTPDIETMESAAIFYTCIMLGVPFICLRGISNRVESRNPKNWSIPLAIENVCNEAKKIFENIA